jgi:hypothetical protein
MRRTRHSLWTLVLLIAALAAMPAAAPAQIVQRQAPTETPRPTDTTAPTPAPSESGSADPDPEAPKTTTTPKPSTSGTEPEDASDADNGSQSETATGKAKGKGDTSSDPLFGISPLCDVKSNGMKLKAQGQAASNCRWSGSIAQPHPTANYGIDQHVEGSLTDTDSVVASLLGGICQLVWAGLLYAIRGVLLLIELAFSNDLVNAAMGSLKDGLARLNSVFGSDSWQLAAISILGLWGIWTGLVRRKTIQTVGGLAAAVGLMIAVQVVMLRPEATVGHVAKLSSQGALEALSGASTGKVGEPADAFGKATQQLFDTLVVHPWCALQFTSVEGCLKPQSAKGQPKLSIADVWLSYPANSEERNTLYKHLDGKSFDMKILKDECRTTGATKWLVDIAADDSVLAKWNQFVTWGCSKINGNKSERKIALKYDGTDASIQGNNGVFTRVALLGMIAFGLIGAICVLLWIGIRLLLASVFSLVLILFAPIVFLMAAFGEAGRRGVIAWGQKLLGLLVAKFIFAVLLAVVVIVVTVLNSLKMSWFPLWMLFIAFWWGLLLKRDELLGFLALDRRTTENAGTLVDGNRGTSISSLYYGWQMARSGIRAATAPARMAVNAGRDHAAQSAATAVDHANEMEDQRGDAQDRAVDRSTEDRTAETNAVREHDRGALVEEAQRSQAATRERELTRAQAILDARPRRKEDLSENRARQQEITGLLGGSSAPTGERRRELEAELRELKHDDYEMVAQEQWAKDTVRRSLDEPREIGARDVDSYVAKRREELALPASDPRNLTAAGINSDRWGSAGADERARMVAQSEAAMARSRTLIDSVSGRDPMTREQLGAAWGRIDGGSGGSHARARASDELRVVRREGRDRRADRQREETRRVRENDRQQRARRHEDEIQARARRRMR